MRRVCSVCKTIFGCRDDAGTHTCSACEAPCSFSRKDASADTEPVLHGMCEACFNDKFAVNRPACIE
jgi:hypothetical protein